MRSTSSKSPSPPAHPDAQARGFWEGVRRLLPVVRTAMEFSWLYPWIVVLGGGFYGPSGPLLPAGWAFILLLAGQTVTRRVLDAGWSLRWSRITLVAAGLFLGLLAVHAQHYPHVPVWHPAWIGALLRAGHDVFPGVPKPAAAAVVAACLWWRSLVLGTREADAHAIEAAYKVGVAAIIVYLIAAAVYADSTGFAAAGPALPPSMPAFFFLGLSGLALARLAAIWERGRPEERAHFPARAWVLLVTGLAGFILLAASATAGLAASDVTAYIGLVLRPLLPVLELAFLVVFFVAEIMARVIIAVLSRLPHRDVPVGSPSPTVFDDLLRRLRQLEVNAQVVEGARWGMVLAVIALLVVGMVLTVVLLRRRERAPDEDEHESVWSARELFGGLVQLLRLRRRQEHDDRPSPPSAEAIRALYRELLRLGAGLGARRPAWATPREHQPGLAGVMPTAGDDVATLTDAYERVRYGAWTPDAPYVRAAEDALRRAREIAGPEAAGG